MGKTKRWSDELMGGTLGYHRGLKENRQSKSIVFAGAKLRKIKVQQNEDYSFELVDSIMRRTGRREMK